MTKVALFVRLEAKPGKEAEVEAFLKSGLPLVQEEPATLAWFGLRLGPSTFGIFDAFPVRLSPCVLKPTAEEGVNRTTSIPLTARLLG